MNQPPISFRRPFFSVTSAAAKLLVEIEGATRVDLETINRLLGVGNSLLLVREVDLVPGAIAPNLLPFCGGIRVRDQEAALSQEAIKRGCGRDQRKPKDVAAHCLLVFSPQTTKRNQVDGDVSFNGPAGYHTTWRADCGIMDEPSLGQRRLRIPFLLFLFGFAEDFERCIVKWWVVLS